MVASSSDKPNSLDPRSQSGSLFRFAIAGIGQRDHFERISGDFIVLLLIAAGRYGMMIISK